MNAPGRRGHLVVLLAVTVGTTAAVAQSPRFLEYARVDPLRVMTAEACGECHASEYEVWKKTPHAEGFKTLHRKPQAEAIAKKMGFRLIKRDSLCFSCHYTPTVQGDAIRVVSGVSCESCHGAGADWIDVHNNYGEGKKSATETADNRRQRIAQSQRAGMRRPSELYPVVANCFSCHTVPNEKLVNVGGHTTGSSQFEFVQWAHGEIRHNFLDSLRTGTFGANAERSPPRKRLMYVVGRALDLEYSLRGVAVAKEDGVYSKAMVRRVRSALAELRAITAVAELPQVETMLTVARNVRVVPRNEAALLAAAEDVGRATRELVAASETLKTAALDPLVEGVAGDEQPFDPTVAVAQAPVLAPADQAPGRTPAAPTSPASGVSVAAGGSEGTPGVAAAVGGASSGGSGVVGAFKRRIRPIATHRTIGPGECGGCHGSQAEWWYRDPHYATADPFFDGRPENERIARLYGVSTAEMTRGSNVCMDCHGTIISGKESRDVLDGVSCEGCHGPAGDWFAAHKDETNKHLGQQRPGHLAALARGKLELRDQAVRARTCAACHYITDERLLSAGHSSGADFDYAAGIAKVRHWSFGPTQAAQLDAAYSAVRSARGPVPDVPRARIAVATGSGSGGGAIASSRAAAHTGSGGRRARTSEPSLGDTGSGRVLALRPPPPRPIGSSGERGSVELPPFPEIVDALSIEERLLLVRDRLRLLYRVVAGESGGGSQ